MKNAQRTMDTHQPMGFIENHIEDAGDLRNGVEKKNNCISLGYDALKWVMLISFVGEVCCLRKHQLLRGTEADTRLAASQLHGNQIK